jgi:hypothetical protein
MIAPFVFSGEREERWRSSLHADGLLKRRDRTGGQT